MKPIVLTLLVAAIDGNGSSWNTSGTATGVDPTDGNTAGVVVGDRPDIICRKLVSVDTPAIVVLLTGVR
jgi:hypothetical protein